MGDIKYNYPVEKLDQLWHMIYDEGITPMMTPDLKAEVELRYYECTHPDADEDDDEEFLTAVERHNKAVIRAEEEKRKSHSRNIVILDLTEEEEAELADGMSMSYIRSDPNSAYNLSDEDISSDETRRRLYKQLCSLGKVYYHQEDFRNAVSIILEAIEYSLRNDYPWLTYEEAVKQFNEGRIKYTFAQMPLLYIDYNTPISDPKTLAGIVTGEITLIDKDLEPEKPKKKHKAIFSDGDIPSPMLRYEANNTTNEVLAYVTDKTIEEKWKFVNERIGELKNSPDLPAYYLAKIHPLLLLMIDYYY